MKIAFVSSECVPFVKTGGLADVAGALPRAIAKLGEQVCCLMPKYGLIPQEYSERMEHAADFNIGLGWRNQYVGVEKLEMEGVTYYFLDNEYYFKQDFVYCSGDFETERFCWFNRAVMETIERLGIIPDILHLNDWQTAMAAVLKRTQYGGEWERTRTIFTIHNLRYQGLMNPMQVNELLGLGQATLESIEYYCSASAMKAGILYADRVTTVSPTYAKEIKTPQYGETLDGLLRTTPKPVEGILNGIDWRLYNPWTDKCIRARFSKNRLGPKAKCKAALQQELELEQNASAPLIGIITRLTNQKGLDLIQQALPGIMDRGAQIAALGKGDEQYEMLFDSLCKQYPGRFAFRCEMNDALARRIYAGADMFLMPSAFEPCGISQMLAQRYACLPIVRETGGLADTVKPYNKYTGEGNGFSFKNYSASELYDTTSMALDVYYQDAQEWLKLARNAAGTDNAWGERAKEYIRLYSRALQNA